MGNCSNKKSPRRNKPRQRPINSFAQRHQSYENLYLSRSNSDIDFSLWSSQLAPPNHTYSTWNFIPNEYSTDIYTDRARRDSYSQKYDYLFDDDYEYNHDDCECNKRRPPKCRCEKICIEETYM